MSESIERLLKVIRDSLSTHWGLRQLVGLFAFALVLTVLPVTGIDRFESASAVQTTADSDKSLINFDFKNAEHPGVPYRILDDHHKPNFNLLPVDQSYPCPYLDESVAYAPLIRKPNCFPWESPLYPWISQNDLITSQGTQFGRKDNENKRPEKG